MAYRITSKGEEAFSTAHKGSDGEKAPLVTYEKRVDGHVYVAQAVVDAKHGKTYVETAFMSDAAGGIKKETPQKVNAEINGPNSTSKNASGSISDSKISQTGEDVKASEKALRGLEGVEQAARDKMQDARNAKTNRDIDNYVKQRYTKGRKWRIV